MTKEKKTRPLSGASALGAGPGRPKGSTNRVTAELKDMILQSLNQAGGVAYLTERAKDPRTAGAFLTLVGKILPMTVSGTGKNGEHVFEKIVVEVVQASTTR